MKIILLSFFFSFFILSSAQATISNNNNYEKAFIRSDSNALAHYPNDDRLRIHVGVDYWSNFQGISFGGEYLLSTTSKMGLYYATYSENVIKSTLNYYLRRPLFLDDNRKIGLIIQFSWVAFNFGSTFESMSMWSLLTSKQIDRHLLFVGTHLPFIKSNFFTEGEIVAKPYFITGYEYALTPQVALFVSQARNITSIGFTFKGLAYNLKSDNKEIAVGFGHPFTMYQFDLVR